jgi:tRNA (guanine-N7-)-methyltransferase
MNSGEQPRHTDLAHAETAVVLTTDGSHTLYVPEIDECYHSTHGAIQESQHIFIETALRHCAKSEIRILEIGFGMGEATAHIAQVRPDDNFLCCEVHEPGVGALLKRIGEHKLDNIRILQHDAVEVLAHMLPEGSLQGIHVFFPDPWHKKKHNKRRLIQAPFLAKLVSRLAPGGYIHCATDWEPYAQQMLEVLSAEPQLRNSTDGFAPRPSYRPTTKFEKRGLRLGHGVWDVIFLKR